jgi:pyridoxamine 5'-phosphate oxidase
MPVDPITRFRRWYADAVRAGGPLPDAVALATADRRGRPSVRYVLLKQVDERGFVFFTDGRSRKGGELRANPHAALAFYWDALGRQVRVEGRVHEVTPAEADAYWATRPRASRLAASASRQSAQLARYSDLLARWRRLGADHRGAPIPRPAAWTGYRIVPAAIEFGPNRLHKRELFTRGRAGWTRRLLQP